MLRRLQQSDLSGELWSGLTPARRKSPALIELLVNLNRSGRLKRTPYRKKPSRSAWIRLLPRARPRRRVSPAPGLLGRRLPRRTAVTGLGLALELYRKGDMTGGDRAKSELPDPLDRELSEWAAVHFGLVSFDRIAAFTREHPDWPVMAALRRRAEEALLAARKPAAAVRAFFAERPPDGRRGKGGARTCLEDRRHGARKLGHSFGTLGAVTSSGAS